MPFADHDDVVQAFTSNRAGPIGRISGRHAITADGAEPFTLLINHRLSLWMSPSMVLRSAGSSRSRAWILPTACRTVV